MEVEVGLTEMTGFGPPLQGRPGPVAETGATVPGETPEAEANVIAEQQWRAIHERRAAGMGVSGIARDLDLDRKTVRSALNLLPLTRRARRSSNPSCAGAT